MTKAELCPLEGRVPKWQLAYFVPNADHLDNIFWDINFQFVLPIIYIKIDGQTNFEFNWTKFSLNSHFIPLKPPKYTKMAIPQNAFFPKCIWRLVL